MGDRANIVFEQDLSTFPAPVYLYMHWGGYKIKQTLQAALKRGKPRWTDPQYLCRIVFCEMIGDGKKLMDETGFGISTAYCDGSYRLLCVNCELGKVRERGSSEEIAADVVKEWTFQEFIDADFSEPVEEED